MLSQRDEIKVIPLRRLKSKLNKVKDLNLQPLSIYSPLFINYHRDLKPCTEIIDKVLIIDFNSSNLSKVALEYYPRRWHLRGKFKILESSLINYNTSVDDYRQSQDLNSNNLAPHYGAARDLIKCINSKNVFYSDNATEFLKQKFGDNLGNLINNLTETPLHVTNLENVGTNYKLEPLSIFGVNPGLFYLNPKIYSEDFKALVISTWENERKEIFGWGVSGKITTNVSSVKPINFSNFDFEKGESPLMYALYYAAHKLFSEKE